MRLAKHAIESALAAALVITAVGGIVEILAMLNEWAHRFEWAQNNLTFR